MIEFLESRIAPASTFGYFDLDGDEVTITSSKGQGTDLRDVLTTVQGDPISRLEIAVINLAADAQTFAGTSLTMTVKRGANGDGFAHIGAIVATGMDLGSITIKGDLGQINVGNPATLTNAFTSLTVKSLGVFGLRTQNGMGDLVSTISGATGPIIIKGDVVGASIVSNDGSLPSVSIGGSIINGDIISTGSIGKITVKGQAVGTSISAGASIGLVTFGESFRFGQIVAASLGVVKIGGDFEADDGDSTGLIRATTGNITSISILGDFLGGITSASTTAISGGILAKGNIGKILVTGDWIGRGDMNSTGRSGVIDAEGRIAKIQIGGNVTSPFLSRGVMFHADDDIGSISIAGDVRGGMASRFVLITAGGQANPTPGRDVAIGKITIGGSAFGLHIAGGVLDGADEPFVDQGNGDAQIGTVRVKGDFLNSNIVSGVHPGVVFSVATGDDTAYTAGTALTNSLIKQIIIGGVVEGFAVSANEHFGFAAQKIGALSIAGQKVALKANDLDRFDLGRTPAKFSVREV